MSFLENMQKFRCQQIAKQNEILVLYLSPYHQEEILNYTPFQEIAHRYIKTFLEIPVTCRNDIHTSYCLVRTTSAALALLEIIE